MGAVYVAQQVSTGEERALKVMRRELVANEGLRKRFEREARAGAAIESEVLNDWTPGFDRVPFGFAGGGGPRTETARSPRALSPGRGARGRRV